MEEPVKRRRPGHLICGKPVIAVVSFLACGYFAYSSYASLRNGDFYWEGGWWITLTWAVWFILTAGLLTEVRCRREGFLLSCVLAALIIGVVFSAWTTPHSSAARHAREASFLLWSLAALASLTAFSSPVSRQN